jgi:hypothetical protein
VISKHMGAAMTRAILLALMMACGAAEAATPCDFKSLGLCL